MGLIDKFEETFLKEISGLNMKEVEGYIIANSQDIIYLCSRKPDINGEIEKILGDVIIKEATGNCYQKLSRGLSPESLVYPEYFSYALQENKFSSDELHKINLQNDSWKEDFIIKYAKKDLLKCERERLMGLLDQYFI